MNSEPREDALIRSLVARLPRSALQLNGLGESDAELVRLPGFGGWVAITTDQIVEEIRSGLYEDPYLAGWMSVLVNASDLAAVGADPMGIVLSETLPHDTTPQFRERLQTGIADAARACALPVLGGDTNFDDALSVGGTAIGWIADGPTITRRGARVGDLLYATAPLGAGSAFALAKLLGEHNDLSFRPAPRLAEGRLVRAHATSAIDTSDGVLPALEILMRLADVAVEITAPAHLLYQKQALQMVHAAGLPEWTLLAGPHGEFELLFTIPAKRRAQFLEAAHSQGLAPLCVGRISRRASGSVHMPESGICLEARRVRDLHAEAARDPRGYIERLLELVDTGAASCPFLPLESPEVRS